MGMDGETSLDCLVKEAGLSTDDPTIATSLSSFYSWLYEEELVSVIPRIPLAQESLFEIVLEGTEDESDKLERAPSAEAPGKSFRWSAWEKDRIFQLACCILILLGVTRLAWVIAPAFEPAFARARHDFVEIFLENDRGKAEVSNSAAVRVERKPQPVRVDSIAVAGKATQIRLMREKLAACRICRDEYYLQNNEEGYRQEVEKMTALVRKIGELEVTD